MGAIWTSGEGPTAPGRAMSGGIRARAGFPAGPPVRLRMAAPQAVFATLVTAAGFTETAGFTGQPASSTSRMLRRTPRESECPPEALRDRRRAGRRRRSPSHGARCRRLLRPLLDERHVTPVADRHAKVGIGSIGWPSTVRLVTSVPSKLSSSAVAEACERATTDPIVISPANSETERRSERACALPPIDQTGPRRSPRAGQSRPPDTRRRRARRTTRRPRRSRRRSASGSVGGP